MKLKSSYSYIIDNVVNLVWMMVTCPLAAGDQSSVAARKKARETFYRFFFQTPAFPFTMNETDSAAFENVSSKRIYARLSIFTDP